MRPTILWVLWVFCFSGQVFGQQKKSGIDLNELVTPYEGSGGKRTATYTQCVEWYRSIQKIFP
ncbi:MAG: hypothetical protein ACK5CL_10545, partial [Sphingomonadales bacterium]